MKMNFKRFCALLKITDRAFSRVGAAEAEQARWRPGGVRERSKSEATARCFFTEAVISGETGSDCGRRLVQGFFRRRRRVNCGCEEKGDRGAGGKRPLRNCNSFLSLLFYPALASRLSCKKGIPFGRRTQKLTGELQDHIHLIPSSVSLSVLMHWMLL